MDRHRTRKLLTLVLVPAVSALVLQQSPTPTDPAKYPRTPAAQASAATSTSTDVPLWLWGVAESLLSEYYPSVTDFATVKIPGTLVIGGTTYELPSPETTGTGAIATVPVQSTSSASQASSVLQTSASATSLVPNASTTSANSALSTSPTQTTISKSAASATTAIGNPTYTGSPGAGNGSDTAKDRQIAIAVGVVLGLVALALLVFLLCVLRRRRQRTGSAFKHRQSRVPLVDEHEPIGPQDWMDRDRDDPYGALIGGINHEPRSSLPPPMSTHPNQTRLASAGPYRADDPFLSPEERAAATGAHPDLHSQGMYDGGPGAPHATDFAGVVLRGGGGTTTPTRKIPRKPVPTASPRADRPPTPLDPLLSQRQAGHPANGFTGDYDDDFVTPLVPPKHHRRRDSPVVHYPSWSEVSNFDFGGDGQPLPSRGRESWSYPDARRRQGDRSFPYYNAR